MALIVCWRLPDRIWMMLGGATAHHTTKRTAVSGASLR